MAGDKGQAKPQLKPGDEVAEASNVPEEEEPGFYRDIWNDFREDSFGGKLVRVLAFVLFLWPFLLLVVLLHGASAAVAGFYNWRPEFAKKTAVALLCAAGAAIAVNVLFFGPDATARCEDGTLSYSDNRSGTCSWHGGVDEWLD